MCNTIIRHDRRHGVTPLRLIGFGLISFRLISFGLISFGLINVGLIHFVLNFADRLPALNMMDPVALRRRPVPAMTRAMPVDVNVGILPTRFSHAHA
jgi:hypothetical protein